ncbi:MAG: GAF domain-containing protein [bacterium]|nr:GAF domain-containing protein [bacterium]
MADIDVFLESLKARWKNNLDQLYLLYDFLERLANVSERIPILETILEEIMKVFNIEAATIYLFDRKKNRLVFSIIKGPASAKLKDLNVELKPGEGIAGWVFSHLKSIVIENAHADPRLKRDFDFITGFKTQSVLAVPIVSNGIGMGVIELINKKLEGKIVTFTESDKNFMESIGYLAGLFIEKMNTIEELRNLKDFQGSILESMPGGFIAIDRSGVITHFNRRASEILKLPQQGVIGEDFKVVLISEPQIVWALKETIETSTPILRSEMEILKKRPPSKIIGYSTLLIQNKAGDIIGAGIIFQDLTGLKK